MARRLAVREFQRRQKQAQEDPYYEPLGGPGALAGLSKAWEDSRLGLGDDEDDDEDYDEDDDEDEEGALILLAQAATAPGSGASRAGVATAGHAHSCQSNAVAASVVVGVPAYLHARDTSSSVRRKRVEASREGRVRTRAPCLPDRTRADRSATPRRGTAPRRASFAAARAVRRWSCAP